MLPLDTLPTVWYNAHMGSGEEALQRALEGNRKAIEAGLMAAQAELDQLKARSRRLDELIARGRAALGETSSIPLTLHDALALVLREHGNPWMSAKDLSAEVTRRGLYTKRDGSPLEINQVHARTNNYSALFEKQAGRIRLKEEVEPMT